MQLRKESVIIYNPISKYHNRVLQEGYDSGYTKGLEIGQKKGYDIGFAKGENIGYIKATKEINEAREDTIFDSVDGVMLWLRSIIEIRDTSFFKYIYFSSIKAKTMKQYLDFVSDIKYNDEYKLLYPDMYYFAPELKVIFERIYDNKLSIERACELVKQ